MQVSLQTLLKEALSAAAIIEHPWPRSRALLYMARLLSGDLLLQAVELARALDQPSHRAIALAFLARQFSDQQKGDLLNETHQVIQQIADPAARLWPLTTLTSQLSDQAALSSWREILDCIPFESDLHQRSRWLAGLPVLLLPEGLDLIHAIPEPTARAAALIELAGSLPGNHSAPILAEALDIVRHLSNPAERAFWGAALVVSLPEEERPSLVEATFQDALDANDPLVTVAIISYLAGLLPASLLTRALELAQQLPDPAQRVNCLAWLAPHLPETQRTAICGDALLLIGLIPDEWPRGESLELLSPLLPFEALAHALEICRLFLDPWARAEALGGLSACLDENLKETALNEAVSSARSIESPWGRARALTSVAAHLVL